MAVHPIIEYLAKSKGEYSPDFFDVINLDDPFERTFTKLYTEDLDLATVVTLIDEGIVIGHKEPEVYIEILFQYISKLSFFLKRESLSTENIKQKIFSIFSILKSSYRNEEGYSLATRMHYKLTQAFITNLEGDFVKSNLILRELMNGLNRDNPSFGSILSNYYSSLSSQGMLDMITPEQKTWLLEYSDKYSHFFDYYLQNSIFTLQTEESLRQLDIYLEHNLEKKDALLLQKKNILIYLNNIFYDQSATCEVNIDYTKILELMMQGNFKKAEILYQQFKENQKSENLPTFLDKNLKFHFAFANREKGKIQWMLKEKSNQQDYLDDFLWGRLHLLNGDMIKADECFRQLMKNVHKYNAMNRILYELRFAHEIKYSIALRIASGWPISKNHTVTHELPVTKKVTSLENATQELIIGVSTHITNIKQQLKLFAKIDSSVLILGETGTGKELVAKAIHEARENYSEPFLAINCGALTDSLLQSELFGYVAGAFTGAQKERKGIFEAAGAGTVFLDEFGDVSSKLQISLLRVLESNEIRMLGATSTKKIKCKIIVATNTNLEEAVTQKKFREDLYFRLKRFEIQLPPLRERKEDIPLLAQHFLDRNNVSGNGYKQLSPEILTAFMKYHWPGNIRELKNEIERLYILSLEHSVIPFSHSDLCKSIINPKQEERFKIPMVESELSFESEEVEKNIIENIGFRTERRFKHMKELFRKYKKLSRVQIIALTKVSPATASKDLAILCEEGFIKKVTPSKSLRTHYFEIL